MSIMPDFSLSIMPEWRFGIIHERTRTDALTQNLLLRLDKSCVW